MAMSNGLTDRLLVAADFLLRAITLVPRRLRWQMRNAKFRRGLKSIGERVRISEPAEMFPLEKITIGSNVVIHGPALIEANGGVCIGSNVAIARGCQILTSNHIYDGEALPWDHASIHKQVVIGDNVWIGTDVIILPGVTLHEGAVVGAGSVVTRDVPACGVVAGNPARIKKYRDVERYERNKREGRLRLIPDDISRCTLVN